MATTYKDNNNVNLIVTNEDLTFTNPENISITELCKPYSDYSEMQYYFRFDFDGTYSYNPYIQIKTTDGKTHTINTSQSSIGGDYQYYTMFDFYLYESKWNVTLDNELYNDDTIEEWIIYAGNEQVQPITPNLNNDFNIVAIYNMTSDSINQLLQSSNRFQTRVFTHGTESNYQDYDLADYIFKIYKSFVNIDFETKDSNVIINGFATSVKADVKKDLIAIFKTDDTILQGVYSNVLDNNSDIKITLPLYNGIYLLDSKYLNHKINFRYVCDISSNKLTIEVLIDDNLIDILSGVMGYEIPLFNDNRNDLPINNSYSFIANKISVNIQQKLILEEHYETFVNNTKLTDFKGKIKADNINFNGVNISQYEQNELKQLLLNGIKILT